ncbi:MAG: YbhB/YbcL family Raf kinase inhibitor-like protein [Chitinophagales bacterium]|nr:YbhB/YbcL family Raf kinase inhibitor-like protein [Chitinophagales bacterium]
MVATLKISSEVFGNNGIIPTKYTTEGLNINPALIISGLPMNTKTLVLILEALDGPKAPVTQWVVWNISPTNKIRENIIPGEEGMNDLRRHHYSGPNPPAGERHKYAFKIWALDNFLHLDHSAKRPALEVVMAKHVIGFGEIIASYQKKLS